MHTRQSMKRNRTIKQEGTDEAIKAIKAQKGVRSLALAFDGEFLDIQDKATRRAARKMARISGKRLLEVLQDVQA